MMVYVLLLVSFLLPAHAAIVSSVSNIPDFVNLTLANESSLPSDRFAIESNTWEWYCSPSHRWNQPPMELGDCRGMLGLFYYETMMDGGRTSMEFISPGAKKTRKMKGQMTPRKYTFGTCTLAIVLVSDFPDPGSLPGGYKAGPRTESTTYLNLNRVAANLVERCVTDNGEAGWQPTGQYNGIGVFVWSTDSQEDKEIENEQARFRFPTLETLSSVGSTATS